MTFREILADLASFLRKPVPLRPAGLRAPGAGQLLLRLTMLEIGVLGTVVMLFVKAWQAAFNLPEPDAFDGMSPLALWGGAVVLAPVLEELVFRGWLVGRRGPLWAMAAALAGMAAFVLFGKGHPVVGGLILLVTAIALAAVLWRLRGRDDVPGWFSAAFPVLFYAGVLVFAATHLFNYPQFSLLAIPMILPQAWSGLMFAYTRLRIGLFAGIVMHIASNAVMLALALLTH